MLTFCPSFAQKLKVCSILLGLLTAGGLLTTTVRAQFTYSEDFKNSSAPGWDGNASTLGAGPGIRLTSGATPNANDPEFGRSTIDPSGAGWLRLTNTENNQANATFFATPIPSAGNKVTISFGFNAFAGNNYSGYGADGLTFFLYDASASFAAGANGGSIGYAQKSGVNGLAGGYIGVALDVFGNYSNPNEGRSGGVGYAPNAVVVRGPGSGTTGYDYLAGTTGSNGTVGRNYTDTGSPTTLDAGDGVVPALPYNMAFPTTTARPNQTTQYRNVQIILDETNKMAVSMQFGEDGLWYNILNVDLSSFARPDQLRFGYSAGTGGGTMVYEVGNLLSINATAGSGQFVWDNDTANSKWGTGVNDPINWAGNTNPTLKANVIFNSTYISTAQNVDLIGSDKVVKNVYLSGPNAYTLSSTQSRKLIMDADTGLTTISVVSDVAGNSSHTIAVDVQMNKNLQVSNNISSPFTISGGVDTGGNILETTGSGNTTFAGAITNTGSINKTGTGTTTLSGNNTYTGATTVTAGTLAITSANALGATGTGTTVVGGATLALAGTGTTFAAEALTLNGDGVGSAGALRNTAGANTYTGNVALATAGSTTIGVDTGTTLNLSGIVTGSTGNNLTKTGTGTLTLSGANTYAGITTVNQGAVAISADTNLGTAPGSATPGQLTLNGGTLENTATMILNANRGIALGASGGTLQTDPGTTLTYNGIAAGTGALNKTGTGTLNLGGTNTYTGATNINAGTLTLGANNVLANTTAVTIANAATFNVNGQTNTIGSLAGAAGSSVTLGTGTLTTGDATNTTFSGVMSGTGSLIKAGTGTMTFSGANTATGTFQVNAGTLQLGASNILANTSTLALNGGTFALGGNFSDSIGSLSLLASSKIDFFNNTGNLTFGTATRTAGTLTIDNWSGNLTGTGNSQLIFSANPLAALLTNINFTGYGTGAIRLASGEIVPNTGGTIYTTTGTGAITWGTNSNWSPSGFAQNIGDTAILGSSITSTSTVTLGANRTLGYLTIDNNQSTTVTGNNLVFGVAGGSAQLIKNNTGTSTVASGILLTNALAITRNGTGTLTVSGGITNNTGTNNLTFADNNATGSTVISGVIATGAGTVTKNGAGTVTLAGANTYTGATAVNAGTLAVSADNNLGATTAALTLNGGTLQSTATFTLNSGHAVTLGTAGGTFNTDPATTLTFNGVTSGTGALNKTGAGTLTLGGANTYTGATNINAGTLTLGASNVLATTAVTVANAATFNVNGQTDTIGSLSGVSGSSVTLGSGALTTGDATNTAFAGIISGTGTLNKIGAGTFTLTGANTYTGATTVSTGVLNIQNNTALGTNAGATTIANGAALEVQGGLAAVAENITLNGTGVANNGALRNVSGNNTLSGAVTLGSATKIQSDAGLLTLSGAIGGSGQNLTLDGAGNITVSGVIGTAAGTLTKTGIGYAILSGANTYTGATTVSAGTLEVQNAAGLGTSAGGTSVTSGATLAFSGGITSPEGPLTLNGNGVGNLGALRGLFGANTLSGAIALGSETYIGVDSGATLTSTGAISGGFGITKVGTGTLVLNSATANTYTGTTAVSAGTLEVQRSTSLGSINATTVADASTLRVNSSGLSLAENITVTGNGFAGAGAIQNTGGSNTITGLVSMTGNTLVASDSTNVLTVNGAISGAGFNLVKTGDGGLTLAGANTYTGTTTLRNGTLTLAANAPIGANGALGNASSNVQIGDASTAGGNNLSLLVGPGTGLAIDRQITVGNYGNTVTLGGTNTTGTNSFTGNIGLAKDVSVTAAAGGTVAVTGDISGTGGLTKTGTGTVTLSGNNAFAGNNTVSAGTLVAASNNALGSAASTTSVASGSTLALQGGVTLANTGVLTLNGAGVSSVGALNSAAGSNTIAGAITLGSATTIGSATAGTTLTLGGVVSGANNLTTTGAGNITFNAANTLSGSLTVGGSGSAITTLGSGASFANVTGVTINTGNTLALGAVNQFNNSANLTLAGGTLNVDGFSATFRQLTQSTASTIDYLNDGSVLRFNGVNGSVSGLGTLSGALTIANWAGSLTGSGTEQLVVYSTAGAPVVTGITFAGWGAATTIARNDIGAGYYEILPNVTANDWNVNGNGTWGTGANWTSGSAPNSAAAIVRLGNLGSAAPLTTNPTITVSANTIVGTLIFDNSTSRNYTISGAGRLDFGANATVIVNDNGAHTIATNGRYAGSATITNNSTAATGLTLSGQLDQRASGTLAVTGTGTTVISGVITQASGTTALLKTGTGSLVLSNAGNAYTGTTTLRNGTLEIDVNAPSGANGALGNAASAVIVNDASTTAGMNTALLIGSTGVTVGRDITIGSQGATTTLGGTNTTGTNTFSGAISLAKDITVTSATGGIVALNGTLSGTGGLIKTGAGTVSIGGTTSNTFTGNIDIQAGTLSLAKTGGFDVIGPIQGAIGDLASVTLSGATAVLSVGGPAGQTLEEIGSLAGVAGSNVNVAQATAFTLYTGNNNNTTTFAGTLTDTGGALSLDKQGTGTMTLSGANTYRGTTVVETGTLVAANNTALGSATGNTTVNNGATLGLQGNITITGEQINLTTVTVAPTANALSNLSGSNTITGNISLVGANANDAIRINAAGGSDLTLSGVISEATNAKVLTKVGTGTLVLSGANTYTGLTNITAGTLTAANNAALGSTAGATSVQVGATLAVQNNITLTGEAITLYNATAPTAPSLKNNSGANTVAGPISLAGANNNGVIIDSNTGNLTLSGVISQVGTGNFLTKTGAGTVTLAGTAANTFTGAFNLNDGTVVANKTAGQNATGSGAINIGDGIGAANSATLQLAASHQLNDTSAVTIATDGRLDLQANSDTIGALTMGGGAVIGTGTLTLGGNLTFNGIGTATAAISSNVNLGGNRTLQVGNNAVNGDSDLTISGAISGTGNLTKIDLGTLALSGTTANTYTGTTTVTDGLVTLNKTAGVQALGSGNVTVGDGVGAASSASLKLLASNQIANATSVAIASDGKFDLNGNAQTIATFTGTGLLDTGAGGALIAGGTNANWTFSGSLAGTGSIDKVGTGSLTFDQNINFTGGTFNLVGGTLILAGINFNVGTLHITGNTTIDFGNSAATILNAANVIVDAGVSLSITNWVNNVDYFYATSTFPGAIPDQRAAAPENQIAFAGYSNNATVWQSYDHQITPAPEPSTYGAIFLGACVGLLYWRRRRSTRE
jgi:fibronectin-binding autotransporter adhesin